MELSIESIKQQLIMYQLRSEEELQVCWEQTGQERLPS